MRIANEQKQMHGETYGSPCMKTHLEWASTLPCKVIYLDGEKSLLKNTEKIITEYRSV